MAWNPSTYKLVEQPNSGALTGPKKVQFVFAGLRSTNLAATAWAALLTAANSYEQFRGYYIDIDNCRLDYSAGLWTLYLAGNSDNGTTVRTNVKHGDTVWNLSLDYTTVPLESLDDFLMRWSYDLFYAVDTTEEHPEIPGDAPAAVKNATDGLKGNYAGVWAYAKSQPANFTKVVDGEVRTFAWTLFARREKGNIQGKMEFTATVTQKKYFRTRAAAVNALATPNSRSTPAERFGFPSGNSHWILQPDGITQENDLYVTNNKYLYSAEWDSDLYK